MEQSFGDLNEFNSDATGQPFEKCLICEENLLESGVPYSIEKAKKVLDSGEEVTLYEMAICMPCAESMGKRVSAHSRMVMDDFFHELKLEESRDEMSIIDDPQNWKNQCLISKKPKAEIREYNLVGQFRNGKLFPGLPPMLIDNKVLEPLQEKLSPETREEFDNFRDQFLSPDDPELRALLAESSFVFL